MPSTSSPEAAPQSSDAIPEPTAGNDAEGQEPIANEVQQPEGAQENETVVKFPPKRIIRIDRAQNEEERDRFNRKAKGLYAKGIFTSREHGTRTRDTIIATARESVSKLAVLVNQGKVEIPADAKSTYKEVMKDLSNRDSSIHELMEEYGREATPDNRGKLAGMWFVGQLLMDARDEGGSPIEYQNLPEERKRMVDFGQYVALESERLLTETRLASSENLNEPQARKLFGNYYKYAQNESLPEHCKRAFAKTAEKLMDQYPYLADGRISTEASRRPEHTPEQFVAQRYNERENQRATEPVRERMAQAGQASVVSERRAEQAASPVQDIEVPEKIRASVTQDDVDRFLENIGSQQEYAEWIVEGNTTLFYRMQAQYETFGWMNGVLRGIIRPYNVDKRMVEVRRRAMAEIENDEFRSLMEAANKVEFNKSHPVGVLFWGIGQGVSKTWQGVAKAYTWIRSARERGRVAREEAENNEDDEGVAENEPTAGNTTLTDIEPTQEAEDPAADAEWLRILSPNIPDSEDNPLPDIESEQEELNNIKSSMRAWKAVNINKGLPQWRLQNIASSQRLTDLLRKPGSNLTPQDVWNSLDDENNQSRAAA